jgi:hypothetical protein
MGPTNQDRAETALDAVEQATDTMDLMTRISDFLCNLHHLCADAGLDFYGMERKGKLFCDAERDEDPTPPKINVVCSEPGCTATTPVAAWLARTPYEHLCFEHQSPIAAITPEELEAQYRLTPDNFYSFRNPIPGQDI